MGVIPVSIHCASMEVVRYALAIRRLMRRWIRMYVCLLCLYFIVSIHTGAPYVSKGRMASLYIVAIASLLIPHDNFAALDRVSISFAHLSAAYFMFLKSEFLIQDKYLICVTCYNGLYCR